MTGIRPGEKIHEILLSEEEAFRTTQRGDYYVLLPQLPALSDAPFEQALRAEYSSADSIVVGEELERLVALADFVDPAMSGPGAPPSHPDRMKVMTIVSTRPELIRLSLVFRALDDAGIENILVHTGQNYDPRLSDIFFSELDLPAPDLYMGIRAERAGEQIGQIIARSEAVMVDHGPDALLILGDTNSGLSAIAATRLGIPIFHMEAGNRCFDWSVPEEKNRKIIDHISDWLLPYTPRSREHLVDEGIDRAKILVSGIRSPTCSSTSGPAGSHPTCSRGLSSTSAATCS
jgi:hypothetical protein